MAEGKSWNELTQAQRAGVCALTVVQVALLVAALLDLRRRPAEAINGSKRFWKVAVFVNYIGPMAYFWKGRRDEAG